MSHLSTSQGEISGHLTAHWIWLSEALGQSNVYLHARKRFVIESLPARANLSIACAHIYRLYVNGVLLGRGPDRASASFPYFDVYDIREHLQQGENVIACLSYYVGDKLPGRVWALYDGPPGLLVQLDLPTGRISSDASWKIRRAPGYLQSPRVVHAFRGFKEYVDAQLIDTAWNQLKYDDSSWPNAKIVGTTTDGIHGTLLPREIPRLTTQRRKPHDIWARQQHLNAAKNLYLLLDPRHAWRGPTSVELLEPDETVSVDVDLSRCMAGFPHLAFDHCCGGRVDVYLGDTFHRFHEARIQLPPSDSFEWTGLDWRGGRYLSLEFSGFLGNVEIRDIAFDETTYPFEDRGNFSSSDVTLDRVWSACSLTARSAVQDHPVDCIGREQAIWLGDLVVHSRSMWACFGDVTPAAKALRQTFRLQRENGALPVPGPGDRGFENPDFPPNSLHWFDQALGAVRVLRSVVLANGDLSLARELLPGVQRVIALLDSLANDAQMIENNPQHPVHALIGWTPFPNGFFATNESEITELVGLQAIRLIVLDAAADLAQWTNQPALEQRWREQAIALRPLIHERFFDKNRFLYRDVIQAGKAIDSFTQIQNAYASLAGILPAAQQDRWLKSLMDDAALVASPCPFDTSFIAEAFFRMGRADLALGLIRRQFGAMVVDDGFPQIVEYFDTTRIGGDRFRHPDWSRCHPFGTGPAYLFEEFILGVQPLTPGYQIILIEPNLADLQSARGTVPLPGAKHLTVELQRTSTGQTQGRVSSNGDSQIELRIGAVRKTLDGPGEMTFTSEK